MVLSNENNIPLYIQLAKILKKQINETMKEDDKIPSEKEICDMYSVSRTTVRLALATLEKEALIYRLQGKGSFVSNSDNIVKKDIFNDEKKLIENKKYEYILVTTSSVSTIIKKFDNKNTDKILYIQYLVLYNNEKVMLIDYYFNYDIEKNINEKFIENIAINDLLVCFEEDISKYCEKYIIENSSIELSNKLDIKLNTPLLCLEKKFYDSNGAIILECVKHIVTERYEYSNL